MKSLSRVALYVAYIALVLVSYILGYDHRSRRSLIDGIRHKMRNEKLFNAMIERIRRETAK